MDYGKFKYELAKKGKISKKKQHSFQLKEMRFRPKIDEHDYQFKLKHVREFLELGSKVRVFVMFRGREVVHIEFGRKILDRMVADLEDICFIDVAPKREGKTLSMIISPNIDVIKRAKAVKLALLEGTTENSEDKNAESELKTKVSDEVDAEST